MRGFLGFAFLVLLGLGIVALLLAGVWRGMQAVSPDAARIWALVATLAIPAAGFACFKIGRTEARAAVDGLKVGVSEVQKAATAAASLGLSNVRTTREIVRETQPATAMFVLPPINPARQIGSGQEVVEV